MTINTRTKHVFKLLTTGCRGLATLVAAFIETGCKLGGGTSDRQRATQMLEYLNKTYPSSQVVLLPVKAWSVTLLVDTCIILALLYRCWPSRFVKELGAIACSVPWAYVRPLAPHTAADVLALVEPLWGKPEFPIPVSKYCDRRPAPKDVSSLTFVTSALPAPTDTTPTAQSDDRVAALERQVAELHAAFSGYSASMARWRDNVIAQLALLKPKPVAAYNAVPGTRLTTDELGLTYQNAQIMEAANKA
jgi:hypothetical protein